jgi:hypothetical protein
VPSVSWVQLYLAGYALYVAYKTVYFSRLYAVFSQEWVTLTLLYAAASVLWPVFVVLELFGIQAPVYFLLRPLF